MTLLPALSILAVALGQTEPQPPQPIPLPEPRLVPAAPRARAASDEAPAPPPKPAPPSLVPRGVPVLALDRTSRCFERALGGRWRAQCDSTTKQCLVAPDAELSAEGLAAAGLDRVPPCVTPGWREDDLAAQGYAVVPALAETPPGWIRDERQRIMQVNFDLNRRIWLGAGYGVGGLPGSDAGEATAGVRWDLPFRLARAPALARLRAFETYAAFDGNLVDFTVVGLDASRAYPSPLIRITTFVGKPRRFDPPLYVGAWIEAVRVETLRTGGGWYDRTEIGAAALTLDLWRSRDLASFVRLRGGAGYEIADQLDGAAWVPQGALDLDLSLDADGFHHVRFTALAERLVTVGTNDFQPSDPLQPRLPETRHRYTAKAEYEVILLAVNDQPLTGVLDLRAQQRNDVPGLGTDWSFQGTASVRFNLWAPPRRSASSQEKL